LRLLLCLIMYNVYDWYFFRDGVDEETCEKLKDLHKQDGWKRSYVDEKMGTAVEQKKYGEHGDYKEDPDVRTSDVAWVNDQWVYDLIWPYMEEANEKAGWKYRIKSAESVQLTRYNEGGFYDFHRDGTGDHLSAYQINIVIAPPQVFFWQGVGSQEAGGNADRKFPAKPTRHSEHLAFGFHLQSVA